MSFCRTVDWRLWVPGGRVRLTAPSPRRLDNRLSFRLTDLDGKHVRSQIPDPPTKTRKRLGRPRFFDKETYHGVRYNVERFFGWLENFRKVAVR